MVHQLTLVDVRCLHVSEVTVWSATARAGALGNALVRSAETGFPSFPGLLRAALEGTANDHDDDRRPYRGDDEEAVGRRRLPRRLLRQHPPELRHRPPAVRRWCDEANLDLFGVRRAHLELFGRWMEENGRMRSTVARRLSTLASFYRYCEQEGLVERNPAANVRRPKVDYDSRTLGLDRNELGAFMVQAGLGSARDHALASLLALNGLRISEALGPTSTTSSSNAGIARRRSSAKAARGRSSPWLPDPPERWTCTSGRG